MLTPVSLLTRIQMSSSDADWTSFCKLYYPLVQQWIKRSSNQVEQNETEDLVQEVFLDVHRNISHFIRHKTGSLRSWLRCILHSKLTDLRRKQFPDLVNFTELQELIIASSSGAFEETKLYEDLFEKACNMTQVDFTPSTWEAFFRTQIQGEDPQSVAQIMNITRNAVYMARFRVLKRMEEVLDHLLG